MKKTIWLLSLLFFASAAVVGWAAVEPGAPNPRVTLELKQQRILDALSVLFKEARLTYRLEGLEPAAVQGTVTTGLADVPLHSALRLILRQAQPPLTFRFDGSAYVIAAAQRTEDPSGGAKPLPTPMPPGGGNRPGTAAQAGWFSLTALDLGSMHQDAEEPRRNRSVSGLPLMLGDVRYERGIGTRANSVWRIGLDKNATEFQALVGVQESRSAEASVEFKVYVDGVPAAATKVMRSSDAPVLLKAKLAGASELKLVVTDGGDGSGPDQANWVDPRVLLKDPSRTPYALPPFEGLRGTPTSDAALGSQIKSWTRNLVRQAKASPAAAVARWKMLVLMYPNTDTDYHTVEGGKAHFKGSLKPYQVDNWSAAVRELPDIVRAYSGGYTDLSLELHIVDRPLTLASNGSAAGSRLTHQGPLPPDYRKELDQYNKPRRFDSVAVLYYPGPVPQELAGSGGGSIAGTHFDFNYGDDRRWTSKVDGVSWGQNGLIHEWTHGLDGFFSSLGYELEHLHHVYQYKKFQLADSDFLSAIYRGNLLHENDSVYEFSKSVWMAGTPLSRSPLPPCQLLEPLPGATLSTAGATFRWAASDAPDGYELRVFRKGELSAPALAVRSVKNAVVVPAGRLEPGDYVWQVLACNGVERSGVGDSFPLRVVEPGLLAPVRVEAPVLSDTHLRGDGQLVRIRATVSSPAGLERVTAEYVHPSGHRQRVPMRRRSPFPEDTVWVGALWMPPNATSTVFSSSVSVQVRDKAGREAVSATTPMWVNVLPPPAPEDGAAPKVELIPSAPLQRPERGVSATLVVQVKGAEESLLEGNVWAELTYADGTREYSPLTGEDWEATDAHVGPPERRGVCAYPATKIQRGTLDYCYRSPSGKVVRSRLSEPVVLLPTGALLPWMEGEALSQGMRWEGAQPASARLPRTFPAASEIRWVPAVGDRLSVTVMAEKAGEYDLVGGFTRGILGGTFQLEVNGQAAGGPLNTYAARPEPVGYGHLGRVVLKAGANTLRWTALPRDPRSRGGFFAWRRLLLSAVSPDEPHPAVLGGGASEAQR